MKKLSLTFFSIIFFIPFVITTTIGFSEEQREKPIKIKLDGTKIKFKSIPKITLKDFLNGTTNGKESTITGILTFPSDKLTDNLPVVIILHGSGGLHNSEKLWAQRLNKIGIATFAIDSNKGRRCSNNCYANHQGFPNMVDGYRALELLSSHPNIDPNRIALLGFSVGGHSTLYASMKRFQVMWGTPGLEFAAYVSFYPSCNIIFNEEDVISDRPIRVLHGALDEWGSAEVCKKYVDRLQAAGKDITMTIFPDAHHSFDMKMERPITVGGWGHVNCHFIENDELGDIPLKVSQVGYDKNEHKKTYNMGAFLMYDKSCGTKKARIEYNEKAAKKSIKIVKDFFVSIFKLS